ncbi:hypothetical protein A3H38_04630 [candidate division WOR-1 bacterium RIFCSPLOWO2_02_FULL_46_20]|uniref:Uncharacterized protein n=1 Tax=candidate division WOR-1 bacterium RIFCSPLOWO2_02_FULL_46_20 TaxID=1802567 RepID=A0A1F4R3Z9_UNCSA|nr:MAG: hypothetical protein A3H38_04630 [candidate division WOR-1 bacterium RIFCSPLOWO2_02_FULL_46_20]
MRKIAVWVFVLVLATMAAGADQSGISREDLSMKAGASEPGEALSLVWVEAYVYPKEVKEDRVISLGVRVTTKLEAVEATFDFNEKKVALTSQDGLSWSGAYQIPDGVEPGLHVARYGIIGVKGRILRTVDFFVKQGSQLSAAGNNIAEGEIVKSRNWPLTVTATGAALVDGKVRILNRGHKVIGVSKVSGYQVILEDGSEAWLPMSMVNNPLDDYYKYGYQSYQAGDYLAAIDYYKNTIAMDSDFANGYFGLARSYYKDGDLEGAYRSLMQATRRDDHNMEYKLLANTLAGEYFTTARSKFNDNRFNEAVAAYQKVLQLKPSSTSSWINLGKCYVELGLALEADESWREAFKLSPEDTEIHALLRLDTDSVAIAGGEIKKQTVARVIASKAKAVAAVIAKKEMLSVKVSNLPPVISDDTVALVKGEKTKKGTSVKSAVQSVVALTKSLGTPVKEKGWQTSKSGKSYLVRFLCEQGTGVIEAFEWLVDVDTKHVSASNANARLLMDRW